jgi:hypothetical protein
MVFRRCGKKSSILVSMLALSFASCSFGPSPVHQPSIDASAAASRAIETYDKNGDAVISGDELEKAPALKAGLPRIDTSGDKGASADEIAARINTWKQMRTGLTSFTFTVTVDGAPLTDAIVTFEPDPILGDDIKAATSTTNVSGRGRASVPAPPDAQPSEIVPGMQIGLYRVKVSKIVGGKETIAAKYNTETTLGQEVALDVAEIAKNHVTYALKH